LGLGSFYFLWLDRELWSLSNRGFRQIYKSHFTKDMSSHGDFSVLMLTLIIWLKENVSSFSTIKLVSCSSIRILLLLLLFSRWSLNSRLGTCEANALPFKPCAQLFFFHYFSYRILSFCLGSALNWSSFCFRLPDYRVFEIRSQQHFVQTGPNQWSAVSPSQIASYLITGVSPYDWAPHFYLASLYTTHG
jgi:hypothetical protein